MWSDSTELRELVPGKQRNIETDTLNALDPAMRAEMMSTRQACRERHAVTPNSDSAQSPTLWGIYERRIGDTEYPEYSQALQARAGKWDRDAMGEFLRNLRDYAPGTTMAYFGIVNEGVRDQVITHLETLQ